MSHTTPRRTPLPPRQRVLIASLALIAPILVMAQVWLPEISHFSSPRIEVPASSVEQARRLPQDAVLAELREFHVLPIDGRSPRLELRVAEGILRGRLELPELPAGDVSLPFSPDDFDRLPGGLQLPFAAYVVPDFLLAAYVQTDREDFFVAAQEFISSWARFERESWLPKGLLWNDHAIVARVRVLAEFWRLYRSRPDYHADTGRLVLEQAARYGHFLASPQHFTFSTNHGLMQNLGLLQLSLSFPDLPDSGRYQELAIDRLDAQLPLLIDDGGVVQENSAGYQAFDLHLLGMTFRSMTLLGDPVHAPWAHRYRAGLRFLEQLRRPDGTLPAVGDTDGGAVVDIPRVTEIDANGRATSLHAFEARAPDEAEVILPDTGYWVHWDGLERWPEAENLSQTVVTWAGPPAPGHKHADELSLLLWSDDTSWLTSVGYWPYGESGRTQAESWDGANAPHGTTERSTSERITELLGIGRTDQVIALDLERSGPSDFRARRQVLQVDPNIWIVLDVVQASEATTTTWTMSPELDLRSTSVPGSYELEHRSAEKSARISFDGSPGTTFQVYRGSLDPFAGWHVVDGSPEAAPAVMVDQPDGDAWLATAISLANDSSPASAATGGVQVSHVTSADVWALTYQAGNEELSIERSGDQITVDRSEGTETSVSTVRLTDEPATGAETRVRAAYESMARQYPVHLSWPARRTAATMAIPLLFVGQELVLFVVNRRWSKGYLALRFASLGAWVLLGLLLTAFFIPTWLFLA